MKKQMRVLTLLTIVFSIIISYQNCGTQTTGSMFARASSFGMPYEMKLDQIAYMSCSEQLNIPNPDGVFYTFRVGAYDDDNAGIRLSEDFMYATRRQDKHDRKDTLANDAATALTKLQFGLRQSNALYRLFLNSDSGEGIEEIDYDTVFGDIGSEEMSAGLLTLDTDKYMNYWPAAGINKDAYFEGTLVFNSSENLSEQVRTFMGKDGILALAFSDQTDPATIVTPYDYIMDDEDVPENLVTNVAFGVGLKMSFKQASPSNWGYAGQAHLKMPKRVLASVYDYNLTAANKKTGTWTCPSYLQLRIVYPEDADNEDPAPGVQEICDIVPDSDAANHPVTMPANIIERVRNSLPGSDWHINLARQCVVPKRFVEASCYGYDEGQSPPVTNSPVFDFTQTCDPAINPVCLHFVSICLHN